MWCPTSAQQMWVCARPEDDVHLASAPRPARHHSLHFSLAGELAAIGLGHSLFDFRNLPYIQLYITNGVRGLKLAFGSSGACLCCTMIFPTQPKEVEWGTRAFL